MLNTHVPLVVQPHLYIVISTLFLDLLPLVNHLGHCAKEVVYNNFTVHIEVVQDAEELVSCAGALLVNTAQNFECLVD